MKLLNLGLHQEWLLTGAKLPPDILQSISKKITVYSDYVRFRAVCPQWRSSVPRAPRHLPSQLPWLMLPLSQSQPQSHRSFYDLSTGKTYHLELPEASSPKLRIGSSNGWLVIFDESPDILLLNPLTRCKLHLPPLSSFPNVVSFDNSEVDKEYVIQDVSGEIYRLSLRKMRDWFIKKIVLSLGPMNNDNFVAVAILCKTGDLAYCKNGDQSWTFINDVGLSFLDVTYSKEQFYAVDGEGAIAVCDVNGASPSVSVFKPPREHFVCHMLYLVNYGNDELLLVARYLGPVLELWYPSADPNVYFKTLLFEVSRMNWSGLQWDRVVNLGDQLLFIGENSSVSLSVSDVRGSIQNRCLFSLYDSYEQCPENCIYFTDDHCVCDYDGTFDLDRGIYMLCDAKIGSLPCGSRDPHALWVTPSPS